MSTNTERKPPIAVDPLRMCKGDGTTYTRSDEIEAQLVQMSKLPLAELLERAHIDDENNSRYVPSECLLYFVRRFKSDSDEPAFRELFLVLRQRVLRAAPISTRRLAGSTKLAESSRDVERRDATLHSFQELLCSDRRDYDARLDFYEIRFNDALAKLRISAHRKVSKPQYGNERVTPTEDSNEPSSEVETALAALKNSDGGIDFLYRSKLFAAINALPPDKRRVVELWLQEMPIESNDSDVLTMTKVLNCSEKTVRNRRDRAFEKLREALNEEEDV